MAETYCGKSCQDCTWRQENGCPGCKTGPGAKFGGACEIAKCALERGHAQCGTCSYQANCVKLTHRDTMPQYRQRKKEQAQQLQWQTEEKNDAVRRWLWVMFWLVIAGELPALLQDGTVCKVFPGLYTPGVILSAMIAVGYGLCMLMMRNRAEGYGTAGVCTLIGTVMRMVALLFIGSENPWSLALLIPAGIIGMVAERHEYLGHADVLVNVDDELSDKWDQLWKWYLYCYAAILTSLVLVFIIPVLGGLLALAGAIGLLVVRIIKLVYLYRTANAMD